VQYLAFYALPKLAYFVKRYLAYSALQLLAFPVYPSKNPPLTVASGALVLERSPGKQV